MSAGTGPNENVGRVLTVGAVGSASFFSTLSPFLPFPSKASNNLELGSSGTTAATTSGALKEENVLVSFFSRLLVNICVIILESDLFLAT